MAGTVNPVGKLGRGIAAAFKAFQMQFSARSPWAMWSNSLGRTNYDYGRNVGDGRGNSIVMAVLLWQCRTFPEAPLQVVNQQRDGSIKPVPGHPMAELIHRPNPFYSGELLWFATLADWLATGNAYWLKVRNASGNGAPLQLWWVPSQLIEPKWPQDGSVFIDHYDYSPNGVPVRVEVADVVHFRYGIDPKNMRKGLSPMASLAREVFTDDEAANFSAALLRNLGVPGVIVAPADDVTVDQDDADRIKAEFEQRFGNDNRGRPLVMSAKVNVTPVSFNPQQMVLKDMRRIPEERVSAIFGVPAIVAGLGAGLDRSTFANYAEAREAAYESNIIPNQRLLASELDVQLLPDFESNTSVRTAFDLTKVRVLQDDENKKAERIKMLALAGLMTQHAAQAELGIPQTPGDDVLYVPINVTATAPDELLIDRTLPIRATEQLPAGAGDPTGTPDPNAQPPANGNAPAPGSDQPGKSGAPALVDTKAANRAFPAALHRMRARLQDGLEADVSGFLAAQGARVVDRLQGAKSAESKVADPTVLFPDDDERRRLAAAIMPFYRRMLLGVTGITQSALAVDFELDDPATRAFLEECGERIVMISDSTRDGVRQQLSEGQKLGETLQELAKRLQAMPEFGAKRALVIARTETGDSSNRAALATFKSSGVVEAIQVHDGDYDEDCANMDGQIFPIEEAASVPPLGHPNCLRAFAPLTSFAPFREAAA